MIILIFHQSFWDSGSSGTAMSNCTAGNRCSDISYGGSTLTRGTTYYWRIKFWDDDGAEGAWSTGTNTFSINQAPTAPTSLETEGQTNPTNIADWTPELTAIGNDPDSGDILTHYDIEVDDNSDFSSTLWHPGKTDIVDFTAGDRCSEISYTGPALNENTQYYWRIKFWDDDNTEGAWSTETAHFTTNLNKPGYCFLEESDNDSQIIINWTDDSANEDGYTIERSVNAGAFANLTSKAANTTSHTDTDISSNNTYQYRIRATLSANYSAWCSTDTLDLGVGSFKFEGLKMEGLEIN